MPAMEKRERFVAICKMKSSYLEYKKVKTSDQPDTPRPADFTSKRSWESAVFCGVLQSVKLMKPRPKT